jgi:hypothetical protein
MAAGLGFKTFSTGDVLSATDVNGYLMQGILVFASATARDAAITAPAEGQFAYLKDTNVTTYYTGSAWANVDTTGMTNPMTTTGDTIYSSSGSTPARLGIGTAGQVLQVNSGATAPEWATPAGGGANWSLLNAGGTTLTGAQTITVSGISGKDKIMVAYRNTNSVSAQTRIKIRLNTDTGSNYTAYGQRIDAASSYSAGNFYAYSTTDDGILGNRASSNSGSSSAGFCLITGCNSSGLKAFTQSGGADATGGNSQWQITSAGVYDSSSVITSISLVSTVGNFDTGVLYVYASA